MRNVATLCLLFLACACSKKDDGAHGSEQSSKPAATQTVLCLNAASTKDVLSELGASFQRSTGIVVKFSPEDSSKLATQIAQRPGVDRRRGQRLDRNKLLVAFHMHDDRLFFTDSHRKG